MTLNYYFELLKERLTTSGECVGNNKWVSGEAVYEVVSGGVERIYSKDLITLERRDGVVTLVSGTRSKLEFLASCL